MLKNYYCAETDNARKRMNFIRLLMEELRLTGISPVEAVYHSTGEYPNCDCRLNWQDAEIYLYMYEHRKILDNEVVYNA
tara:strand:+ start:1940 stop:2176 length:237 start_codon:yes stop_codon:yes gene_type:complete